MTRRDNNDLRSVVLEITNRYRWTVRWVAFMASVAVALAIRIPR